MLEYQYSSLPIVFTARGRGRRIALTTAAPVLTAVAPTANTTLDDESAEEGEAHDGEEGQRGVHDGEEGQRGVHDGEEGQRGVHAGEEGQRGVHDGEEGQRGVHPNRK